MNQDHAWIGDERFADYDQPRPPTGSEIERRAKRAIEEADAAKAKDAKAEAEKQRSDAEFASIKHISECVQNVMAEADNPVESIPTPFPHLNRILDGGFRRGEYVILGARPSIGKSALALEIVRHAAHRGHGALIVSVEMTNEAVARRALAQEGRISASGIRKGHAATLAQAGLAMSQLYNLPIWSWDKARDVANIAAAVAWQVKRDGLKLVVVDYLQIVQPPRGVNDKRGQIEAISAGLKRIAHDQRVTVIALSSLSRPQGQGEETPPSLASLRDSGALEHDADTVLLMHRKRDEADTKLMIAKQRDGATGVVDLTFRPEHVGFDEIERESAMFP